MTRRARRLTVGSRTLLAVLLLEALGVLLLALAGEGGRSERREALGANRALVRELQITDLALWSEASYTRHPTQADFFAPFADHPAAFEHFPAGSLVAPPGRLLGNDSRAPVGGEP